MRQAIIITVILALCAAGLAQTGTFTMQKGQFPWHDRVGQWALDTIPDKYLSDKPLPQQACGARTLVLPAEGQAQVVLAVLAQEIDRFVADYEMTDTGDRLTIRSGGNTLEYAVVIYKNPPKQSAFTFSSAGVILVAFEGEYTAPPATGAPTQQPPAANEYAPAEGAPPWHDRVGKWVIADVPAQFIGGKPVPQQGCGARTLEVPAGLSAVTIAISDGTLAEMLAAYPSLSDTGMDLTVQSPGGAGKLPYSVVIYKNPPAHTDFSSITKGGIVLLSLGEPGEAPPTQPQTGGKKVLEQEQEFVAQEWPFNPGERKVKMWVVEPPAGIDGNTGLMLVLHNWGGVYNSPEYIKWCNTFAERFNVVAASVNYLQSGSEWKDYPDRPYDHGYLQAMDCIGALYHIYTQLKEKGIEFNEHRVYAMGGSGGGNVTQMVMKLAPHTFACGVDICGMPGLTDGIAYGTGEYGSQLNARYSQDPASPQYLTKDMQEIRDFGNLEHCRLLKAANPNLKIVICHGVDDRSCPVVHKITQFRNMIDAGLDVDGHFFTEWHVDGSIVTSTGHPVGDREQVVVKFADAYMKEDGTFARATVGTSDFTRKGSFEYPTTNGKYVIDYSAYPKIEFVPKEG